MPVQPPSRPPANAVLCAVVAFGAWGILPIYWHAVAHLGSDVAIAQRVVWTTVTVLPLLWLQGEWSAWLKALRQPGVFASHSWSAFLLGINWGLFIWATHHGRILDCSLGYFINPLLNVFIGRVVLGERLSRLQALSIVCAAAGVIVQVAAARQVPWIGLSLALTFALYGLARRRSSLGSLAGLGAESVIGFPFAAGYLIFRAAQGGSVWGSHTAVDLTLIAGLGVITAIPLLGFAHAARLLPFALLGLLQFLAPTGHFIVGAFVYGEPISSTSLGSFVLIWTGVIIFCMDLWHKRGAAPEPAVKN